MRMQEDITTEFQRHRLALLGLAYRMTGSRAEAEDLVQDVYLTWQGADRRLIDSPRRWLMTVCSRRAIDMLRSARVARTQYVGPWLPEPLEHHFMAQTMTDPGPEESTAIAESVTTAFLLALERLSPKERAAFLLHDIFDEDYAHIAATLGSSEPACRKLVSRARQRVKEGHTKGRVPPQREKQLIQAFMQALQTGDTAALATELAEDAILRADGGGKAIAAPKPIEGLRHIVRFIGHVLSPAWQDASLEVTEINGTTGIIVRKDGGVYAAITFASNREGKAADVFIVRNPDKLKAFS